MKHRIEPSNLRTLEASLNFWNFEDTLKNPWKDLGRAFQRPFLSNLPTTSGELPNLQRTSEELSNLRRAFEPLNGPMKGTLEEFLENFRTCQELLNLRKTFETSNRRTSNEHLENVRRIIEELLNLRRTFKEPPKNFQTFTEPSKLLGTFSEPSQNLWTFEISKDLFSNLLPRVVEVNYGPSNLRAKVTAAVNEGPLNLRPLVTEADKPSTPKTLQGIKNLWTVADRKLKRGYRSNLFSTLTFVRDVQGCWIVELFFGRVEGFKSRTTFYLASC